MLFNSFTFWIFFLLVFVVNRMLPHRWQNRWLLFASYVFYGNWDWRFLGLLLASTVVDFFVARAITVDGRGQSHKRALLLVSLVANLGTLAVFKYLGFFVTEAAELMRMAGLDVVTPTLHIVLPVGISFYTFQTMSYTIDVYRGHVPATRSFPDFALYVSFFPQLVAGPIERYFTLMPQISEPRKRGENDFRDGLYHVLTGLFLKMVVADNMAMIANHVFGLPDDERGALAVMIGIYAFAFQIYGDFAGYSAIAKGVARWLGFNLMSNFRRPYLAASPREFWQRWHISLSSWLRDYLYIPLGGNRGGAWATCRNLMITMLLGGFWHGANWTFLIWGGIHGAWLVADRMTGSLRLPHVFKVIGTFHLVCLTWLFFRAESLSQAMGMLASLFSGGWAGGPFESSAIGLICFFLLPWLGYELWVDKRKQEPALVECAWWKRALAYIYLVTMILYFSAPEKNEFIYFQF